MPVNQMPDLLSQLERLRAPIWVGRMTVPASGTRENPSPDRLLEVAEAAKQWPFAVRIGPGQLRVSERGLESCINSSVGRA